ncbi:hypothetical protein [Brevundimonas sp.]|uniref:hypothetical protein n=1 Tax=Brevundimonas sp. TaxID=1871086 RepID=UPI0028A07396|nr:hypothetical protein [Brevundimonas sp.]
MSAGHHITVPFASWEGMVALLGALGLGGVLTALAQRPSRRAVDATAAKDEATGEAAVIASIATAFTGTTGALREEIERMQIMLNELRTRVVEAEAEIRAAALREADQARIIADLREQLEVSHADVVRLRAERDTALASTTQKEGEVRQLKAVIDAHARATT